MYSLCSKIAEYVQSDELRELGDVRGEGAGQLVTAEPQEEQLLQLSHGGRQGGELVVAHESDTGTG